MRKLVFPLFLLSFSVAGCAATALKPGAAKVRVVKKTPKGCEYIDDVTGSQGNFFTGQYTSNTNLETGARNSLKNQAFELGGNVVVLITERAGQSYNRGSGGETNITLSGAVYKCPKSVLDNM